MQTKTTYRLERFKTIVIGVLLMTLISLTALNVLYDREDIADLLLRGIQGTGGPPSAAPPAAQTVRAVFPLAAAVRRDGALTGAAYDDAVTDALYDLYGPLLGTTLASARDARRLTREAWRSALGGDGVYFGFGVPVPSWLLADSLSQTESAALNGLRFRALLLCEDSDGGWALIADTDDGVWRFGTPLDYVPPEPAGPAQTPLPAAAFACERGMPETPDMLFAEELAHRRPILRAGGGGAGDASAVTALLTALEFNPNTNNRYTRPTGEQFFVDGQRTIHISPNGAVNYLDASVPPDGNDAPPGEAAPPGGAEDSDSLRAALKAIPQGEAFWGEGRLCLRSFESDGGGCRVTLSYMLNGAFVEDSDSVFVVRGGRLREAYIRPRPLYALPETRDMLPQRQAAVLLPPGSRLAPAYAYHPDENLYIPYWMYY